MNVIDHVKVSTLPRLVAPSLEDGLRVMPAAVVTGARQTGKSTLAQELTSGRRRFFTLDVLGAARRDPEVLLGATNQLPSTKCNGNPTFCTQ